MKEDMWRASQVPDRFHASFRNMNINMKRGACVDSGPIGLSHLDTTVLDEPGSIINPTSSRERE